MTMSHVLIVDDDPALLQALPEALRLRLGEGVAVLTCDSALAALDLLATTDYDAIITDIKLPGMDGLALLAKIRALRPDTPTLLITGHGEHDLAVQALRGGAYDFIQKPIDRDHLVASLRRALQLRQLSRQVAQQRQALERHAAELEQLVAERTCELRAANQAKDELLHREQAARAEAEAAQRRLAFLAEASHLLAASLDYRSTLASVARLAVPYLADCCIINTLEDDGTTRELTIAHDDPAKEGLVRAWWRHALTQSTGEKPLPAASRPGQPVGDRQHAGPAPGMAANGDAQRFQALGITDRMIVPLLARGRTLGIIAFLAAGRRYGPAELTLADDVARRAALAIDNAQLYREAQAAIKVRDQFLSIAAHELKTPITGIKAVAQNLLRVQARGQLDAARLTRFLRTIDMASNRLAGLTTDLLDASRISLGQLPLRRQRLELAALVREVARRHREFSDDHHRLSVEEELSPCVVMADADRLEQVLTNLLDNAIKYSPEGGTIRVRLLPDGEGLLLTVRDQGIGLPPGASEAIFLPFGRAANALHGSIPGLGLGLYISRSIVEQHGGRIWAESTGEGQGTTLSLWLPRSGMTGQGEHAEGDHVPAQAEGGGERNVDRGGELQP